MVERYGLIFGLTQGISGNAPPSYLLRLYPYMVESIAFQRQLVRKSISYGPADTSITLFHYFSNVRQPSILKTIHRYTIGLPRLLTQSGRDSAILNTPLYATDDTLTDTQFPVLDIPAREQRVINEVNRRVNASYSRSTGIITIETKMPRPELAAQLVQLTLDELYRQASAYKTEKGRLYLDFLNHQLDLAKQALEEARGSLAEFNASDGQALDERMMLQSNYEESLDRYNTVLGQRNRLQSNIQEQLPPFRILDDITVPGQKSEPNRKLTIVLSLLAGFFIALSWITVDFLKFKLTYTQE